MRAVLFAAFLSALAAAAAAQTTSTTITTTTTHVTKTRPAAKHATTTKTPTKAPSARSVAARHVPVIKPRHRPPPRLAVAAARKAVIKKEPPSPPEAKPAPKAPLAPPVPADVGTNSGLHLPRYASLKSDDVNMRVGPAERYPVIWTYKRRELPVKIEREFDIWRLVEDMDGVKGWVHQATLNGRRTFVITGTEDRTMRADASETADAVAILKPGVVGRIKSCDAGKGWCQVQVADYRGWLQRSDIWGLDADEVVAP